MADYVPTSGAWQSDAQLQQLLQAYLTAAARDRAAGNMRGAGQREAQAFDQYVQQNRQRLGIPANYYPDPRTGGKTLYDPNQNVWRDVAIAGGSMLGGAYGLGAALGGGAGAGIEAGTTAGLGPSTPANIAATTAATHAAPASLAASGGAGASGIAAWLQNPANVAKLGLTAAQVALLPKFLDMGGGDGGGLGPGTEGLLSEAQAALALQRKRMEQAQPIYDGLVNMAYANQPTGSRGAAPAGYPGDRPIAGPYVYQSPKFGRLG